MPATNYYQEVIRRFLAPAIIKLGGVVPVPRRIESYDDYSLRCLELLATLLSGGGGGTGIVPGALTVTTATILDGAVTAPKIQAGSITTGNIADAAITTEKIADGSIQTVDLADGAISTLKIADSAITSAKILDGAVGTADLGTAAVTTAKIADANVTTAKIADDAITSAKILDGAIATIDLADGSVTSAKILDGTILAIDIADGVITAAKLAAGAVGTASIPNDAITSIKILDAAITAAKLSTAAVTTVAIADNTITSAKIQDGVITTSKILDGAITALKIQDGVIVTSKIANDAITSAKILDGTITTLDLADGVITSAKILDGTIATADIADGSITVAKLAAGALVTPGAMARQTILRGAVNALAMPNIITTAGALDFTINGSPAVPIVGNFAAGFDSLGRPIDFQSSLTTSSTVTTASANTTYFIYLDRNIATGVLSWIYRLTTATPAATPPIYSPLAPATPVTQQHWFSTTDMVMYEWSGTVWVPIQRVCIGQFTTGASAVTSISNYAYNRQYQSAWIAYNGQQTFNFAHNLGILFDAGVTWSAVARVSASDVSVSLALNTIGSGFAFGVAPFGLGNRLNQPFLTGANGVYWNGTAYVTIGQIMVFINGTW